MPETINEYYLENTSGTHNKFYEIVLKRHGDRRVRSFEIVCRWGRIGNDGQTSSKGTHATQRMAEYEMDTLRQEKLNKGYVLIKTHKAEKKKKEIDQAVRKGVETYEDILLNRFSDILE